MRFGTDIPLERVRRACRACTLESMERLRGFDWGGYRQEEAAVLVPLANAPDARVLLTVRGATLRRHAGQVCFPGGLVDRALRESALEAALREFHEELRVRPPTVLGALGEYPNRPSRLRVRPFAAFLGDYAAEHEVAAVRSPVEVAHVFTVPVGGFGAARMVQLQPGWPPMPEYRVVDAGGRAHRVWGQTACILQPLLARILS